MRKLIAIGFAGLLLSGSAAAQGELGNNLLGPTGVVQSLVVTLTTADAEALVNSLTGANSGLLQGTAGGGLHDVLGGLLADQDPGRVQLGLETLVGGLLFELEVGLGGGLGGGLALPGLDGLPLSGDLAGGLDGILALDGGLPDLSNGGLPGLPGGGGALSLEQLEQITNLLSL